MNGRQTYLDVKVIADVRTKWTRKLWIVCDSVCPKGPGSRRGPNRLRMVSLETPWNAGEHNVMTMRI